MPPSSVDLQAQVADLYHRFRLAFIGYLVFAAIALFAAGVNFFQNRRLDHSEHVTRANSKVIGVLLVEQARELCANTNRLRLQFTLGPPLDCKRFDATARALEKVLDHEFK